MSQTRARKIKMTDYRHNMVAKFWEYQRQFFPRWEDYFERDRAIDSRPPVFLKESADNNILMEPGISTVNRINLLNEIPNRERHRWFRSMSSSQALAQSVFGNLKVYDRTDCLRDLIDEFDESLWGAANLDSSSVILEYVVDYLDEPRPTSIDVLISGNYKVAIECKLTEADVGHCSRPKLKKDDPEEKKYYCDGSYSVQEGRRSRCALTEIGVSYWRYIPQIFSWPNRQDMPCPINHKYQLVRNILSACVRDDRASTSHGHAVLIYDERNPSFKAGGAGYIAYEQTKGALFEPRLLRKCSWQQIAKGIRSSGDLQWLAKGLEEKYGI